jgi:hypothetical protein
MLHGPGLVACATTVSMVCWFSAVDSVSPWVNVLVRVRVPEGEGEDKYEMGSKCENPEGMNKRTRNGG